MPYSEKKQPDWIRRKLALLRAVAEIERKRADRAEARAEDAEWRLAKIRDFMSYSPGLPPLILSIERNTDFMAKLGAALNIFNRDLNEIHKKLLLTKGE